VDLNSAQFHLGKHQAAYDNRLSVWEAANWVGRLSARDTTLWSPHPLPELADRLGWLDLDQTMRSRLDEINELANRYVGQAIDNVLVLGMGGSSLAPEVFGRVYGRPGLPRLSVLDSTHPDAVRAMAASINPDRTIFVVSSKSGTTIETLSFFRFFWAGAGRNPGPRFVVVTDPGTTLAGQTAVGAVIEAPPDVGGRYSALSPFGLIPAALAGIDVTALLDTAGVMAEACRQPAAENPGMQLAAAWSVLAEASIDKLTFLTSPSVASLPAWQEQLIAESLGKAGKGIIPVVDEPAGPPGVYGPDRFFSYLAVKADKDEFARADGMFGGHPTVRIRMQDRWGMVQEMVRSEVATAVAGAALGVHPFDQPDVELSKQLTRTALQTGGGESVDEVRGATGLTEALKKWTALIDRGDYVAIHAYLAPGLEMDAALASLRRRIREQLLVVTTVGYGPRFLHSTGQLHKGGPDKVAVLQLVDEPDRDLAIPEMGATFGGLIAAQAIGDYRALLQRGRRVLRVNLGHDRMRTMAVLAESLLG